MTTKHLVIKSAFAGLMVAGILLLMPQAAYSHNTDNERRTVGACNGLGPIEKRACKVCVRKGPYHYHPALNLCHKNGSARD